jgi:hypothetical protein
LPAAQQLGGQQSYWRFSFGSLKKTTRFGHLKI